MLKVIILIFRVPSQVWGPAQSTLPPLHRPEFDNIRIYESCNKLAQNKAVLQYCALGNIKHQRITVDW